MAKIDVWVHPVVNQINDIQVCARFPECECLEAQSLGQMQYLNSGEQQRKARKKQKLPAARSCYLHVHCLIPLVTISSSAWFIKAA